MKLPKLLNQNGKTIDLAKVKGYLALYFYPKDNTPGCTKQACSIRDGYTDLEKHDVTIYGISADSEKSHTNFIEKFDLPFDLLIDTDFEFAKEIGAFGEKSMYGKTFLGLKRMTFIFKEGELIETIKKPDVKDHANQILKKIGLS